MADLSDNDVAIRFWSNVNREGSCWEWQGHSVRGYGRFRCGRETIAHRVAYILANGAIPEGLEIDHLCRNRLCMNPAHLEAVTHAENVRRAMPYRKPYERDWGLLQTHCKRGHPYTQENTYYPPSGFRRCRECGRQALYTYLRRKRAAVLSAR